MFFPCLFFFQLFSKGNLVELFSDVTFEKLFLQINGAVDYMFGGDALKNIDQEVSLNLYTRKNPQVAQILPSSYPSLIPLSYFDKTLKTYFVIHGYTDHKHREIIANLRVALNNAENCNVIVVDWGRLAASIYFEAVNHTVPVGTHVGKFLVILENFVNLRNVHVIGHSLGAHISGIAGAYAGGRLGRITGLDPAGPLFELLEERNESLSLDKSDAIFVDVIHTDADEYGITKPIGHADFYPNEGTSPQPGCNDIIMSVSCSHIRSVEFYTESIIGNIPFEARHCNVTDRNNCLDEKPVYMGHYLSTDARGVYFLETNAEPPFAKSRK